MTVQEVIKILDKLEDAIGALEDAVLETNDTSMTDVNRAYDLLVIYRDNLLGSKVVRE